MTHSAATRLARQVAHATGTFEHLLLGRAPTSVTVVAHDGWMVVSLHESFSTFERRLAADEPGSARVRDFHHYLFDRSLDSLVGHVRRSTGVTLQGAIAHVDTATGSVLKTFTTASAVDLFLLGRGLPALGVPVNDHRHANTRQRVEMADGTGAARPERKPPGGTRNHEEGESCWC
jgi:uncharacterized protein YbcI